MYQRLEINQKVFLQKIPETIKEFKKEAPLENGVITEVNNIYFKVNDRYRFFTETHKQVKKAYHKPYKVYFSEVEYREDAKRKSLLNEFLEKIDRLLENDSLTIEQIKNLIRAIA